MSTDPATSHQTWLAEYRSRREHLFRPEVMRVSEEAFRAAVAETGESPTLPEFARCARARRPSLIHRFCMVLWARAFDPQTFEQQAAGQPLDYSPDVAAKILQEKARNFLPRMATLTRRLDEAGLYALMLFPEQVDGAPPEPLVLPASNAPVDRDDPESMPQWLYLFTGFAELADAIIVEGNYSHGLKLEFERLRDAALLDRILLFDNNTELYRGSDSHRWPLERLGEAVKFAAAF